MEKSGDQSINTLEQVELGGVKQWISIRGTDRKNPPLLFLHGGPGSANLSKLRNQCPELEEQFVVVNWDQRGAGKNYRPWRDCSTLTLAQLKEDTHQLVRLLRGRFEDRKIYLLGFSWGTLLGIWTARDWPEDIEALISASQVTSFPEGERLSLAYTRQVARDTGNQAAIRELAPIDPAYRTPDWYDQLMRERKWLLAFGGVYHTATGYDHEFRMMLKAPEYSFLDLALWPFAFRRSLQAIWPELMSLSLFDDVPRIDVPVHFLVGRHDKNAPCELTEAFFKHLEAPRGKRLVWFEDSAHDLFCDQPKAVVAELTAVKTASPSRPGPRGPGL